MDRVYSSIVEQHDIRLVGVAVVICLFSCFTTFSLIARARRPDGFSAIRWISGAAFVCGSGIWATHFVAMLGYEPGVAIAYDPWFTLLSALIAIGACAVGFSLALLGRMSNLGGAIAGGADGVMHYIGMTGVYLAAQLHWDGTLIALSLVVGLAFGAAALTVVRYFSGLAGQCAATLLLSIGICGGHFTGMAALTLTPDAGILLPEQTIAPFWLALATTALTLLIAGLGLVGALTDSHIHRIAAANRKLESTASHLAAAVALADSAHRSKAEFLANISHELRTPLNTVIGYSEILKNQSFGPIDNETYRGYAADIFASGTHLAGLIGDIHSFSKLDAGRIGLNEEEVDLAEIVAVCRRVVDLHAEREKIDIGLACPDDLPALRGDHQRLRQIVINLLSNAVKFTPEGGKVRVTTRLAHGALELSVADTGIGMAEKDIPTALARFGQIDSKLSRKYQGTGLGLPLAKELVELHGGTLAIESALGVGTTVHVRFPPERVVRRQDAVMS
jgi:signal transduction histidine kinase